MTVEQLEKANKINEQLEEKKRFLKAFKSPYSNVIRACDYDGDRSSTETLLLENDKTLSDFIRGHISDQIADLEKQLEEL